MKVRDIPQIEQMNTWEKILFLEDLWDSIISDESNIPVIQSHKEELDARLNKYESNPENVLTMEELQQKINQRK
ncbi:MAG: addiction module protein [Calditrichaeota bacterium]|nr:MAG: addiction module protein [Calditrichota bacterium]